MSNPTSQDESPNFPLQDVEGDIERFSHVSHDPATESAHVWEHFRENARWFLLCFLPIILLTVVGFVIDFGSTPMPIGSGGFVFHITGNTIAALVLAAARCGLIIWFLQHLFKDFSFIFRTLAFTLLFLFGMIFLSLWDSEVKPGKVGDPIYDWQHPETMDINK